MGNKSSKQKVEKVKTMLEKYQTPEKEEYNHILQDNGCTDAIRFENVEVVPVDWKPIPKGFQQKMACETIKKVVFLQELQPERGINARGMTIMFLNKDGQALRNGYCGVFLDNVPMTDKVLEGQTIWAKTHEEYRPQLDLVVDEDKNSITFINNAFARNDSTRTHTYKYKITFPVEPEEEQKAGQLTVKQKMERLLTWNEMFNTEEYRGSRIVTQGAIDNYKRQKKERLDRIKQEAEEKLAKEEEQRAREQEEQERLARIAEQERLAREEQERIAARKLRLKRNKELLQQAVEPARLERIRNQAQDKGMAAVFLSGRNMPARVEEKGTSNPTDLRRLAENDSMETVFSMLWILPLLVIFVFWFKRYIVTRKNNDDNVIVQDNVKEEENDLSKFV